MIDNITLLLKKPSRDLVTKLNYEKLVNIAKNIKLTDNAASYLIKHPEVNWYVLDRLASNPSISEEFHKEYTIKHPKIRSDVLKKLQDRFPNTDWKKLFTSNS